MTTYEKLTEALQDLDLTDAKHYAAELERENARLREQLDSALIALEKIANYQGRFGEDDPQSVASDILSNA